MKSALNSANTEYERLADPAATTAALPVRAARLNGLLKSLANAEGAVTECIRARRELLRSLEKVLATNREALDLEEQFMRELSGRRTEIEQKKQSVELAIISGLPAHNQEQSAGDRTSGSPVPEPERPQVEALTPPHVQDHVGDTYDQAATASESHNGQPHSVPFHSTAVPMNTQSPFATSAPGIEMLSNLASQYQAVPLNGSSKKRKIEASEDFPDLGGDDGIDAEVKEMLRKDSHGS
jgi:regulator of Ty1 transposition protein 103